MVGKFLIKILNPDFLKCRERSKQEFINDKHLTNQKTSNP